jgi:predicted HTH transcriptional regulator
VSPEEFAEYLAPGYEGQGYEFKGPADRTDANLLAQVARAALGLANHRGGGPVFIGVDETDAHEPILSGLTDQQRDSWNYDDVAARFAAVADPRLSFDREVIQYQGKQFVVLTIREFEAIPVICRADFRRKTDGQVILRAGALYVRTRGKPETTEVPTQTEMRGLLDLAIDKGLQAFLARAARAGLQLPNAEQPREIDPFARELEDPDA